MCPRSNNPFYVVSYYIKWVTTSWTYSTELNWPYPRLVFSLGVRLQEVSLRKHCWNNSSYLNLQSYSISTRAQSHGIILPGILWTFWSKPSFVLNVWDGTDLLYIDGCGCTFLQWGLCVSACATGEETRIGQNLYKNTNKLYKELIKISLTWADILLKFWKKIC